MEMALQEAKKSFKKEEVPVGAVLVRDGKVIARGHNLIEARKDATAHAELICLQKGAKKLGDWRLLGTTLYATLEPCSMCAGALFLSRVDRLVYGAPDFRHGANGSFTDLFSLKHPTHKIEITRGVMADECARLMQEFFQMMRRK